MLKFQMIQHDVLGRERRGVPTDVSQIIPYILVTYKNAQNGVSLSSSYAPRPDPFTYPLLRFHIAKA